ncbi:nuclease [Phenylobacterium sp. LjRoot219]|uniref:thermonuclease family protein n=1 Tax=Phenylobacterium sp. LjRoot219 TaxID=3342283 RepID=UPI003ECF74BB
MARSLSAPAAAGLVLALTLAVAACRRTPEPPLQAPPDVGATMAERVKVLNADVLVIDGRHVRLADAAAPQPVPDARCWAEGLAARLATAAVRDLVAGARDVRVEPTGRTDEYNRAIAHVSLDNQDLADTLHRQGLVATSSTGRFGWCAPVSLQEPGAPDVKSLMDFSR